MYEVSSTSHLSPNPSLSHSQSHCLDPIIRQNPRSPSRMVGSPVNPARASSTAETPASAMAPYIPYLVIGRGEGMLPHLPEIGSGAEATVMPKADAVCAGSSPSSRAATTVEANDAQLNPAAGAISRLPSSKISKLRSESPMRAATSNPTAMAARSSAPLLPARSATANAGGTTQAARWPLWRIVSSASRALA